MWGQRRWPLRLGFVSTADRRPLIRLIEKKPLPSAGVFLCLDESELV